MSDKRAKGLSDEQIVTKWQETNGNVRSIATQLGVSRGTVYHYVNKLGLRDDKPLAGGNIKANEAERLPLPKGKTIKRYLLTSLQSNTHIHPDVWENILALRQFWKAELFVARFTYNKNSYGKMSVKPGTADKPESELWFDPMATPFFHDEYAALAPGLHWCGHTNDLPTTARPMTGYETLTGSASSIFPHATMDLQCVPTSKMDPAKFMYTTGTIGQMNYLQKKAGIKAEHHHAYGCIVAEVNSDGDWWVRQLHAGRDGSLYDLDVIAQNGKTKKATGKTVFAVNWGDIHLEKRDEDLFERSWGKGGILDELRPEQQFMHDLFDPPRNHHDDKDPYKRFEHYVEGTDSVELMCRHATFFLSKTSRRPWCKTIVVNSNHDDMVEKWTAYADWRDDPPNARFLIDCVAAKLKAIDEGDKDFYLVEHVCKGLGVHKDIRFLRRDEDWIEKGIQFGQHGHLGANGARGGVASYAKVSMKVNIGHLHTCGLFQGVAVAGVWGDLDQGYNDGLSSWSQSMIVTMHNGRRQILTIWKGKHKA